MEDNIKPTQDVLAGTAPHSLRGQAILAGELLAMKIRARGKLRKPFAPTGAGVAAAIGKYQPKHISWMEQAVVDNVLAAISDMYVELDDQAKHKLTFAFGSDAVRTFPELLQIIRDLVLSPEEP